MTYTRTFLLCALLLASLDSTACASDDRDGSAVTIDSATGGDTATPGESASVPPMRTPDDFEAAPSGAKVYDARRAFDLTGDGRPETLVVHAEGPSADSADVELLILSAASDTLYRDAWNTTRYFQYEYRSTFSDSAAHAKVLSHLKRILTDTMFTKDGPSATMKKAYPGGVDRDAVLYDLKDAMVRAKHSLRMGDPFPDAALHDEVEKVQISKAAVDSLVAEVATMPTFRYEAGGELSYTLAWSPSKQRMVRIFACC
ncbi:MAG TPA: hypothetical protein VF035_02770 [Longimicrobiales bacterium]